jgi:bifunctional DNA-binding transcriptional regulator/antitoxin component of YhaV-PrlF toxin-antitoxin module
MKTQAVAIIRDRGQLTIPESIRAFRHWAKPSSVVIITSEKTDEIVIKPHEPKEKISWSELYNGVKKSRAIHGKGKISSADFLAKDRLSH